MEGIAFLLALLSRHVIADPAHFKLIDGRALSLQKRATIRSPAAGLTELAKAGVGADLR